MKELQAICEAYKGIDFSTKKAALATVVRVIGSSYRSPGARMLITDDGKWVGSISGGCLEGDALRKARKVMMEKKAMTVRYDTRDDENKEFAINLGCNGVIDVLIEPVDPADALNPVVLFENLRGLEEDAMLATCFAGNDLTIGRKILLVGNSVVYHNFNDVGIAERIVKDLLELPETRKSRTERYEIDGESAEVFIELIQPPIDLMIFGGGFDARPLSEMAKNLGWTVTVTDECVAHIAPLFFPKADNLSLCHREFIDQEFNIKSNTACVLMSHNYDYDREVLKKMLRTETPYIGILGPKRRLDKMLDELSSQNIGLSAADWERIHAPIGVDIGAETPNEIAIAIIAEIMAKFTSREAGYLKFRSGPIHRRDVATDQVFKEVIR